MYFDKPAKDLTLEEAATIAAIIQTPARLSPFVNPERTLARRNNYVLPRMADEGFITRERGARGGAAAARAARTADARSIDRALLRRRHPQDARAEVRRRRALPGRASRADDARRRSAGGGQRARSTAACAAIDKRRSGYRKPARNVVAEGTHARGVHDRALVAADPRRRHRPGRGDRSCPGRRAAARAIRIGDYELELPAVGVRLDAAHVGGAISSRSAT